MKIHHLNCGDMDLAGTPLICHVLLLETNDGLVLVDSGLGLQDVQDPARALSAYRYICRSKATEHQTAYRRVQQLGFDPVDVTDILLTHMDGDHAGGIADFPNATVHLSASEAEGAFRHPTPWETARYQPRQWDYRPTFKAHRPGNATWKGFEGVTRLSEIDDGILMVPLLGHTRGHTAYAVRDDANDGWILHCGDGFYHHSILEGPENTGSLPLRAQEAAFAFSRPLLMHNQARLRELNLEHEPGLSIINAHDPVLFPADGLLQ
ncbi:MAG: MBL fold metallo-hydrolase [Bifidobacterium sp.]|nr:MBL fold metallo-hydrolase [Bifidobacterium sp.]